MIAVPRMAGLAPFVFAGFVFEPQQSVMLDVVGAGQLPPGKNVVHQQERNHLQAECDDEPELDHR